MKRNKTKLQRAGGKEKEEGEEEGEGGSSTVRRVLIRLELIHSIRASHQNQNPHKRKFNYYFYYY